MIKFCTFYYLKLCRVFSSPAPMFLMLLQAKDRLCATFLSNCQFCYKRYDNSSWGRGGGRRMTDHWKCSHQIRGGWPFATFWPGTGNKFAGVFPESISSSVSYTDMSSGSSSLVTSALLLTPDTFPSTLSAFGKLFKSYTCLMKSEQSIQGDMYTLVGPTQIQTHKNI